MPHECTTCGRTFDDGSKEMLSGCPDCGGNKFQFHPTGTDAESTNPRPANDSSDARPASDDPSDSSFEFGSSPEEASESVTGGDPEDSGDEQVPPPEDRAQASARSTVVSDDELPRSGGDEPSGAPSSEAPTDVSTPTETGSGSRGSGDPESRPDLSALREELNEQFESIKIHDRGEYELNLMELYDREEHIIALQEDGRYVIDVPSSWREDDREE